MKFLILKKNFIYIVIAFILILVALCVNIDGGSFATVYFGYAPRLIPIYSVETDEKNVSITFDSAWGADKTLSIIKLLNDYNVKATFFLCGFWVDDYPEMVRAIDDANIEIGTHSNTHPDFVKLTEKEMELELSLSISKIKAITHKEVKLFRAPFGSYNNTLLNLTDKMSLKTIQWDVDTLDWKGLSGVQICERVMKRVKNGSIILCHNNSDYILDALPLILERLKNANYNLISVGDLIMWDNYYIDHTGLQRKN